MIAPRLKVPTGACDCHMHIYEDRFPLAPTATFKPSHAPVEAYRRVQQRLGLERMVIVQPTGYGFDNRCTLEAMAAFGAAARGIVVIRPEVEDAEIARLAATGVRGVRYHMLPGGALPWDTLETMAARIVPHGWHIQLQLDGRTLPEYEQRLAQLPKEDLSRWVTMINTHFHYVYPNTNSAWRGNVAPDADATRLERFRRGAATSHLVRTRPADCGTPRVQH